MKVIVSKYAGFCPGVKRAAKIALGETKDQTVHVATYGPLVHNEEMIQHLSAQGVSVVEDLANISAETIVVRSHGVSPGDMAKLQATGKRIVNATCPHVSRIHQIVDSLEDRFLVIIGDPGHPEVRGIAGWARHGFSIVPDMESVQAIVTDLPIAVVVQTTFQGDKFTEILAILKDKYSDILVYNTICPATRQRQQEVAALCRMVSLMLVIGGKHSANTDKLVKICLQSGVDTHHIQSSLDVNPYWFQGNANVGIAAGASTPEWIIREVVEMVMDTNNKGIEDGIEEVMEDDTEEAMEDGTEEVIEDGTEEAMEDGTEVVIEEGIEVVIEEGIEEAAEDTNAILEQQSKPLEVGDIVVGKVVQVNPEEILIDVGQKMEGLVRKEELSFRRVEDCAELVSIGDDLEAEVTRLTDDLLELSARKANQAKAWKTVKEAFDSQNAVTGKVVEVVKGGLIVDLGLRGFMPASLVDLRFVEDLSQFVGQEVTVQVIELEKRRGKVIVSRKAHLMQEYEGLKAETLAKLEEDTVVNGIVRRLTNFGAFVDIGGIDGLVHISELAHHRVEHPSEVLQENQEIEVFVLKVDKEEERVSLSLKRILPDPWTEIANKFKAGDVVDGKIVRLADFGAFVELIPGVDGLVHVSQISEEHVEKPEDVLSANQEIKVKILDIDTKAKRVSLSMRDAMRTARKPGKDEQPQETSFGGTIGERLGNLFENNEDE